MLLYPYPENALQRFGRTVLWPKVESCRPMMLYLPMGVLQLAHIILTLCGVLTGDLLVLVALVLLVAEMIFLSVVIFAYCQGIRWNRHKLHAASGIIGEMEGPRLSGELSEEEVLGEFRRRYLEEIGDEPQFNEDGFITGSTKPIMRAIESDARRLERASDDRFNAALRRAGMSAEYL